MKVILSTVIYGNEQLIFKVFQGDLWNPPVEWGIGDSHGYPSFQSAYQ